MLSIVQPDWQPTVTLLVAIAGVTLGIINARYMRNRDQSTDWDRHIEELQKAVAELEADSRVVKKQVALFWWVVEKGIGNMLHIPHRAELDRLIEKNARRERLEPKEVKRFAELLQEIAEDEQVSHGEQTAAVILKAAVLARHVHDH